MGRTHRPPRLPVRPRRAPEGGPWSSPSCAVSRWQRRQRSPLAVSPCRAGTEERGELLGRPLHAHGIGRPLDMIGGGSAGTNHISSPRGGPSQNFGVCGRSSPEAIAQLGRQLGPADAGGEHEGEPNAGSTPSGSRAAAGLSDLRTSPGPGLGVVARRLGNQRPAAGPHTCPRKWRRALDPLTGDAAST